MPNTLSISNSRRPLQASGRSLVDASGNPVLLVGDAAWSGIVQLTDAQIRTYLLDRAGRGFNCVLVELVEHLFGANSPSNIDNVSPWTGATWSTPNNTYFQRADLFLRTARDLGIYVILSPLYLGFSGTEEGWDTEVAAASTGTMQAWGEYCAGRYGGYSNLIWCIGGDQNASSYLTKINAFVTGIHNVTSAHLMTFHDARGTLGSDNLSGASWLTLESTYTSNLTLTSLGTDAYATAKPHINIEARYENDSSGINAQGLRAQAYWAILAGGVGHIFGNDPIWHFAHDGVTADWVNALDDAGSVNMTHLRNLFAAYSWSGLVPDTGHSFLTSGYGTIDTADYAGCGKNAGGTLAIIYMPSNRTMTVDMSQMAGSTTARWYDPTNGSYTSDAASPVAASGTHQFSRAGANAGGAQDWVLVLTA